MVAALPAAGVEVGEGVSTVLHAVEGGDGLLGPAEGAELGEAGLERGARGAAGGRGRRLRVLGEEGLEHGLGGADFADLRHCGAVVCVYILRRSHYLKAGV